MNFRSTLKVGFAACLVAGLCACATSPDDRSHRLELDTPDAFGAAGHGDSLSTAGWLADFSDPALARLVAEAQQNNPDLRATAARMNAAMASARSARSGLFPTASGRFGATRNKRSTAAGFSLANPVSDDLGFNASAAWELDLWGKIQNRSKAATADFEAATADYQAARLSLAANTASAWFNAVEAELQVRLAEQTHRSFQTNLTVIEKGFDRGVSNALDVRLTRANVATARASLKQREQQHDAAVRTLEALLGRYPARLMGTTAALPRIDRAVPAGLPSDLLKRRPDILAAERRLAAADERFKAARKDLFPTISLSANGGTSTSELRDVLDPDSNVWGFAANLTQPIFQGGRLRANLKASEANTEVALANYTQTALTAFNEVETALAAGGFLRDREAALRESAAESAKAEELAWSEYQRGLVDIITVLESQRRAFSARSLQIQISNQRLQNRLTLYLSLGGDFDALELATAGSAATTPDASSPDPGN
ncbi:MAG: efflux transporter outer membrane subunit [Verrucomicrobiia bacterium]|jgi:NodT family efflux transporter outer membrane factor (OMF) lipoprotein